MQNIFVTFATILFFKSSIKKENLKKIQLIKCVNSFLLA